MGNKVSFTIQLKDKFGSVADRIDKKFGKLGRSSTKVGRLIDRLGSKIKSVGRSVRKSFRGMTKGINKDLLALGKGFLTLETAMATIKTGVRFEDAIAELSAITGAKGAGLKALSNDVRRLAKDFGFAQDLVAKGFTQVASSKSELLKTPGAVAKVTEQSLLLARAAGIEIPDAIRASVGALNQFGAGADQAARFVNVIAAGAKVGASQVGETAEALKNAGSVAAQFNISFEETNALLQVLAKNEVKGAEAGTGLRSTLVKLETFQKGMFAPSKIGIIKSLEAIKKLNLSNTKITKDFGIENLRTILILRKNIPLAKQWTNELTGTSVASDQAATRLGTLSAKYDKLKTTLGDVAITIMEGLAPAFSFILGIITTSINVVLGTLKTVGSLLGQIAGAISILDFSEFSFSTAFGEFLSTVGGGKLPENIAAANSFSVSPQEAARLRQASAPASPSAPIRGANGTLSGEILVSAAKGSKVERTSLSTSGNGFNLGMNVPAGAN